MAEQGQSIIPFIFQINGDKAEMSFLIVFRSYLRNRKDFVLEELEWQYGVRCPVSAQARHNICYSAAGWYVGSGWCQGAAIAAAGVYPCGVSSTALGPQPPLAKLGVSPIRESGGWGLGPRAKFMKRARKKTTPKWKDNFKWEDNSKWEHHTRSKVVQSLRRRPSTTGLKYIKDETT